MNTANKLFKSSIARTSLTIISIIISFFMLPFLVSTLGDKWYGIWTIIGGLTGYYYLVDFGLATAVSRYITKYISQNDSDNANIIINTSLVIYSIMGVVICLLTILLSFFSYLFIEDATNSWMIRLVILISGLNLAIQFPYKAFAGIIGAYVRYDLLSYAHFFSLVTSTGLVVYFLSQGYGIVALAIIEFCCSQISNLFFYFISRHLFSDMQIHRRYFKKDKVRELFNYSVWSFAIQLGDQIRLRIDTLVIGLILNASYVTLYFIGARLAELFLNLVYRATNILVPVFTKYHAENNYKEIQSKLLFITKINAIIATFGGGLIILLGKQFILRWMGNNYVDTYPILVTLTVAIIFEIINNPANNVLYAISKHKFLAVVAIVESCANLGLSLILIHYYGMWGVAMGTTIPLVISRFFILPPYVCKSIALPIRQYYLNLVIPILFTVAYLLLFHTLTLNLIKPHYGNIAMMVIAALPLYLSLILFVAFNRSERILLKAALPRK